MEQQQIKGYDVSKPVLHKGKLYLISTEGTLYAFEHGERRYVLYKGPGEFCIILFPPNCHCCNVNSTDNILIKVKNRALVFGSWLIALTGVIFLSLKALEPYTAGFVFGLMSAFVFLLCL